MIEVNVIKVLFWLFWIGITFIFGKLMLEGLQYGGGKLAMAIVSVGGFYLLLMFLTIIAYGGIYWW